MKLYKAHDKTWSFWDISVKLSAFHHIYCFIFVILADKLFKNEPLDYLLSEATLKYYATEPRRREIFERNGDTFTFTLHLHLII